MVKFILYAMRSLGSCIKTRFCRFFDSFPKTWRTLVLVQLLSIFGAQAAPAFEAPKAHSVVILGSGIGALTSAIYLSRAGITPILIEGKHPGGLLTQSHSVQNWPGELEIDGAVLIEKVRKQAEANGALFLQAEVIGVDFSKRPFTIQIKTIDGQGKIQELVADSCIIATGSMPNLLGIPGESAYWGRGVTNCAICDGSLYKGKRVGVVGGGDSAILEALYLSNIASEVFLFVRKDRLHVHEQKRVDALLEKKNVKIFYNTAVEEIKGDSNELTHVVLNRQGTLDVDFPLDGLFLAIGSKPNTALFKNALKLDASGYIVLSNGQQTSVDGVYAIGDVADPIYKQAIFAAGNAAAAALQAQQFLSDRSSALSKEASLEKKVRQKQESALHEVIEIASVEQFKKEMASANVPIVVDFYASWCTPCKRITPAFESSANQLSGKVKFLKVNVDVLNDLSASYGIRSMPTVLYFDSKGALISRQVGTDQIFDLLKQLDKESATR